jgi:hypothetical protein
MSMTAAAKRLLLASALLFSGSAAAQGVGDMGRFQIADEPTTPRLGAMGGVGAAIPGGGFSFYNAASPAFADRPFISVEYGSLPGSDDGTGDLAKSKIEAGWMSKKWFAGASLTNWSTDFLTASEQGIGSSASWQLLQASLTGGFKIGRFAMGNCFDFYQDYMADQIDDQAFTYSPGFLFQLVPGKVTLGGSMRNYVRLDTTLAKFAWFGGAISLPRYVRAGAAWTDTLKCASMPFTAAADLLYSEVYKRLTMPVGVEVWVLPCLAARLGVPIHDQSDLVHFGVGVRINSITCDFDYGLTQPGLIPGASIEQKWLLALSYSLPASHAEERKGNAPASPAKASKTGATADSSAVTVPLLPQ